MFPSLAGSSLDQSLSFSALLKGTAVTDNHFLMSFMNGYNQHLIFVRSDEQPIFKLALSFPLYLWSSYIVIIFSFNIQRNLFYKECFSTNKSER